MAAAAIDRRAGSCGRQLSGEHSLERRRSRRTGVGVLCLALLVSSLAAGLSYLSGDASAYNTRGQILIVGDAGFIGANGVTGGSGTLLDPFVISGWKIEPSTDSGISISGTTKYFVISNVYIHGTGSYDGISLVNVVNGMVNDSVTEGNYEGIYIEGSSNVWIDNCSIQNNYDCGIELYSGSHLRVSNSTMDFNYDGFFADSAVHNVTIVASSISKNSDSGLYFYDELRDCTVEKCTIQANQYYDGVYMGGYTYRTRIANSSISMNAGSGVFFYDYSSDIEVHNNTVSDNHGYGVYVYGGDRVAITDNMVNDSFDCGIYLGYRDVDGLCNISGNTVTMNEYGGIEMEGQTTSVLSNNFVVDTPHNNGISFYGSQCRIENNTIRNNSDFGLRVRSGSLDNMILNNTFESDGMFVDFAGTTGNNVSSNTVNGKPLLFLEGVNGLTVGEAGQVIARDSNWVVVADKDLSNCSVAIEMWNCDDWSIDNVTSFNNYYGIYATSSSSRNTIADCLIVNFESGIDMSASSADNTVRDATLIGGFDGISFVSGCDRCVVESSSVHGVFRYAVRIAWCTGVEVQSSNLSDNSFGVSATHSQCRVEWCNLSGGSRGFDGSTCNNCVIANNIIINPGFGLGIMLFYGCTDNLVLNNTVRSCSYGMAVDGGDTTVVLCTGNIVMNNTVTDCNSYGMYLDGAHGNIVANNTFSGHDYGFYLVGTDVYYNWIYLNNFSDNNVNARSFSAALVNYWNTSSPVTYWFEGNSYTGYLGNYWDDYGGPDGDGNGVGDVPYAFTNGQDNYPLVVEGSQYIPEFPVVPISLLLLGIITAIVMVRTRGDSSAP